MIFFKRIIPSLILATLFVGCEKTELGCTDKYAANYSETANEENGSCSYSDIELVFWLNEERANYYESSGASLPLHVEVDGVGIGELGWDNTLDAIPDCSAEEHVRNYTLEMPQRERSIELKFLDDFGTAYYTTSRLFSAAGANCRNILP